MPAWATVSLALGSTFLGGLIGFATAWLQNRHATGEREAAVHEERLRHAARVLGRIRVVLLDLEPIRIAANVNGSGTATVSYVRTQWLELRDELSVLAATNGSREVEEQSEKLIIEISSLMTQLEIIHVEQRDHSGLDWREFLKAAKQHYVEADRLTDDLLRLVHER